MNRVNVLIKLIYAVSISLVILLIFFGVSELFKIRRIETTARVPDMDGFPALGGKYLFNISDGDIKKHFVNNPEVRDIVIHKKFPNTLVIDVNYRNRIAQVLAENGNFIIDEQGFIFEKVATSSGLPIINLSPKKVNLGTNITQDNIKLALSILNLSIPQNLQIVETILLDDKTVSLTTGEGIQVVTGINTKPEDIVSSLQIILRRFTIEGKIISKIDFRFEKPVITFK